MELTASTTPAALARSRRLTARLDPPAIAAWTLGFAVVAYLALSNGGYDTIVRSQVGIAVWWIVLLGALAGVLPARIGAAGWAAIGLLAGFALWTGLATGWSESAERCDDRARARSPRTSACSCWRSRCRGAPRRATRSTGWPARSGS